MLVVLLDRFFPSKKPFSANRFQLLRNFSIVSLSTFFLATGLLAVFYRQQAVKDLVVATEENNVSITQIFANTLWSEYGPFLSSTHILSDEALVAHPRTRQLREDTISQFGGLSVVKVKIFDLQGRTVFSTDDSQIGADKSQSAGFLSAKSGKGVSQLGHRDTFEAINTTLKDRHLLSSYLPIRSNGSAEEIVGVFELYTDVTPLFQQIKKTQRKVVLGSSLILLGLYCILFFFVKRADYLLEKQYQQVEDSEARYRQQAFALEKALVELRQTQSKMLQSEKMSSLGQMVAGIAHEINNPVNFIHGNLSYVHDYVQNLLKLLKLYQVNYPDPVPEIQAETEEIELEFIKKDLQKVLSSMNVGSSRIREIVLALRIFSRLDEAEVKSVDIHEGIESTLMILNHRLKASPERPEIQVIREYGTIPPVTCYAGLLNQVFMNILANAIDALEEQAKQRTKQEAIDNPSQITLRTSLIDDKWVQIAFTDNGSGITQEIREHIFEPFFTTKPVGKGTGMGMSISYQIITERHTGKLECFSTPGQGTEFIIQIPIQPQKVEKQRKSLIS
ncbi:MAG: ATP-binding protein [Phormidesmis sp.]